MYRTGHAYHPTHPFFMWYWGEAGRQHIGRVIVVGADNEYIPKLLGYETARNDARGPRDGEDTVAVVPGDHDAALAAHRHGRVHGLKR
jgi:hypothetical protein